jgi:MscS family membrane protein
MENLCSGLIGFFVKNSPFIIGVVVNAIIIYAFCKITDTFTMRFEDKLRVKNPDSPLLNLMPILTRIFKVVVIFMLLAGFLQSFGYNVSSLIAGFGITGLAVGFAAKEAIGNVFGSIGLLADRVYKVGEFISFNGYEGTVESINFRSTTIRTPQGFLVNIPNNVISNEEITNLTQITERRLDISVDIEYSTSNEKIDRACSILEEIAERESSIKKGAIAVIDNMAPSSIVVRLISYTTATAIGDYTIVKSRVLREIIHRYREEGIEFAFPSTSLYFANSSNVGLGCEN